MNEKKEKYIYLEMLRVLAIFFVIYNHTEMDGLFLYTQYPDTSIQYWCYLFITILFRVPIQIYFAISGALMLGRANETIKDLWKKKISKMVIVLCIASLLYYIYDVVKTDAVFSMKEFLQALYSRNIAGHLWYLYAYIAFLICLPFVRAFVQNLEDKYFYYMIAIAVVVDGILPVLEYRFTQWEITLNNNLRPGWLTSTILLYPCIGYFFHHRIDIKKVASKLPVLWICDLAGILVTCWISTFCGRTSGRYDETFYYSFTLIHCISIFLTIKWICDRFELKKWFVVIIKSVGQCTFGIYLFHMWLLGWNSMKAFCNVIKTVGLNPMLAVWTECICIMIICYCITWVMRKIPIVKNLF